MPFVPNARLSFEDDGGFPFTLKAKLVFEAHVILGRVTVPVGFKTDLASIPRLLWNVLPPIGKYDAAAVVHDYLYQNGWHLRVRSQLLARSQADRVLREAMQVLGVSWGTRWAIYLGVRLGGWVPWNNYRKAKS